MTVEAGSNEGNINQTLEVRGSSHGNFSDNTCVSQKLKDVVRDFGTSHLDHVHLEALDMIFHKISRIACGDPEFSDHWHDIAGYATLVEQMCGT